MTSGLATSIRLRAERPWREHEQLYRDLFGDPAVGSTLWPGTLGGARNARQSSQILTADIAHWHEVSFGPWVFFQARGGMFIGRGGLRRCQLAGVQGVEVLYAVRSHAWGDGYASEMAAFAVMQARRLGIPEIVGFTAATNRASRRVLEKIGLTLSGSFEYAGVPHVSGRLALSSAATQSHVTHRRVAIS